MQTEKITLNLPVTFELEQNILNGSRWVKARIEKEDLFNGVLSLDFDRDSEADWSIPTNKLIIVERRKIV